MEFEAKKNDRIIFGAIKANSKNVDKIRMVKLDFFIIYTERH